MNIYPNKPYSRNKGLKLPEDKQKEILDKCQHLYDKMIHAAIHINDDDIKRNTYFKYHHYLSELEKQEIYVEYNWLRHRREHFFATEEDADWQELYLEDCAEG